MAKQTPYTVKCRIEYHAKKSTTHIMKKNYEIPELTRWQRDDKAMTSESNHRVLCNWIRDNRVKGELQNVHVTPTVKGTQLDTLNREQKK